MSANNHNAQNRGAKWRDYFTVHPACALLPPMTPEKLELLGKDIKEHGLQDRIVLFYDGERPAVTVTSKPAWWRAKSHLAKISVGDGQNRLTAGEQFCDINWEEDCAVYFRIIYLKGDRAVDPWAYSISANLRRRHLKPAQRRELIAAYRKLRPDLSNNAIAQELGVSDGTVASVTAELEAKGEVPKMGTRVGLDGKKQAARKPRDPKSPVAVTDAAKTNAKAAVEPVEALHEASKAIDTSLVAGEPINLQPEAEPKLQCPANAAQLFDAVLKMLDDHVGAAQAAQVRTRADFARKILLALDITADDLMPPAAEAAD